MHREFDNYDRQQAGYKPSSNPNFDMYRNRRFNDPKNRLNTTKLINSQHRPTMQPKVKRKYMSAYQVKKRYKVNDLNDNGNDGSLWASQDKNKVNYLFTKNERKQNGDIVLIEVYKKLKNEITAELKRAFPAPIKKKKDDDKKKEGEAGAAGAQANAPAPDAGDEESEEKIYDRLSSVIIEEINQDHLLVRGRKNLLYRNRKRLVEVQALVSRRDVTDNDTINSNKILESSVQVIR